MYQCASLHPFIQWARFTSPTRVVPYMTVCSGEVFGSVKTSLHLNFLR